MKWLAKMGLLYELTETSKISFIVRADQTNDFNRLNSEIDCVR